MLLLFSAATLVSFVIGKSESDWWTAILYVMVGIHLYETTKRYHKNWNISYFYNLLINFVAGPKTYLGYPSGTPEIISKGFLWLVTAVDPGYTGVVVVSSESCFFQRCLGCHPQETVYPGSPVDCHPNKWVSAEWIHNLGHPPPSTDSRIPVEMRCLKMVATPDDKSYGNTVDTIRGCVPRVQVESVCVALVAVERARGHSDARCFTCTGDNCNGTDTLTSQLVLLVTVLYFVLR